MSRSMKVRSIHTQETKEIGIGLEHVDKNLARSFSAWDVFECLCVLWEGGWVSC